jgi:hypothetical protein
MNTDQSAITKAEKNYDDSAAFFRSQYPWNEKFAFDFTNSDMDEFAFEVICLTADAMEAGVDRRSVRLHTNALVLRRLAVGKHPKAISPDRDSVWDELLAAARASRPGNVVLLKPEGEQ